MRLKKAILICLMGLLLFVLCACTGAEQDASTDVSADESSDGSLTIEDAVAMGGFYKLKADGQSIEQLDLSTEEVLANAKEDKVHGSTYIDEYDADSIWVYCWGEPIQIDTSAGEKLIVSSEEDPSVHLKRVVDHGYCQGGNDAQYMSYEEVDGVQLEGMTPEERKAFWKERGIVRNTYAEEIRNTGDVTVISGNSFSMYQSEKPIVLDAGWYEGTTWVDGSFALETPYYVALDYTYSDSAKMQHGESGYFTVDLSEYKPGLYVMHTYSPEILTVIEIL